MSQKTKQVLRGEVYLCSLGETKKSVQGGTRPVVVIQNNYGNRYSPTVIVAPITGKPKKQLATHVDIELAKPSIVLCEQILTIPKDSLGQKIHYMTGEELAKLDHAIAISIGLG